MHALVQTMTRWTTFVPVGAVLLLIAAVAVPLHDPVTLVLAVLFLGGSVLAAVHHAEVVAHRVGEPFGSLILAIAVTIIEVGLIMTIMAGGKPGTETLARDTVFAAVMITCNLIVGLALFIATLKPGGVVRFNADGAVAALATVLVLAVLTMVLPSLTTSAPGPQFTETQLGFAAVTSLVLYVLFVTTQTVRHRNFFLPVDDEGKPREPSDPATRPSGTETVISLVVLLVALVAVVGLAKVASPAIEAGVSLAGLPKSFVGVIIALLVLAPETLAAVQAARRGTMQISLNLAYGSAIASIGLTVPAIAIMTLWNSTPLMLGLDPLSMALLVLTGVVSTLTVVRGRATRQQAGLHLVLAASFIFLAANP